MRKTRNHLRSSLSWVKLLYLSCKVAMSNPKGLLGQKSCRYLNQGRIFDDILMKAAHSMTYVDLSKSNLAEASTLKVLES